MKHVCVRVVPWLVALCVGVSFAANIKNGEKVYKMNCVSCHGEKGKGDGPAAKGLKPAPRDFSKGKFKFGCSPSQLAKTVKKGSPGTAMPPWEKTLKPAQVEDVVHYILHTFVPKKIAQSCMAKK